MLTSYTSSEEENIPYLRKSAQNIRNNNEGASAAPAHRPQVPDLVNFSPLPTPWTGPSIPLKKLFYGQC